MANHSDIISMISEMKTKKKEPVISNKSAVELIYGQCVVSCIRVIQLCFDVNFDKTPTCEIGSDKCHLQLTTRPLPNDFFM